ncbi:MAG: ParB/RepB/Spo0J family partition protein [Planctomycetota bacterium]|nr:ParB/RepB/Spo0J family partition protein [Planctomycetota bacterium]
MISNTSKRVCAVPQEQLQTIDVNDICENPKQPRAVFNERELKRLAVSLMAGGLLQPIGVRPLPEIAEKKWELIWGERRLRAAVLAGRRTILARVCIVSAPRALLMMGDENLNRADWNPIEKAKYFLSLTVPETEGGAGMTITDIAKHYRKSRPWVANLKRLLSLPESWQQRIINGEISQNKANRILPYVDQPAVLARIAAEMEANPRAWRTPEDFERNAKLLAEDKDAQTVPINVTGTSTAHSQEAFSQAVQGHPESISPDISVTASDNLESPEPLAIEERMTRLAETFPSLKGAPGVSPWNAEKLFHCTGPMSPGERLAALFCLHVWNPGKSSWETKPFNLFEAVNVWDSQHLNALRAWLCRPFMA